MKKGRKNRRNNTQDDERLPRTQLRLPIAFCLSEITVAPQTLNSIGFS